MIFLFRFDVIRDKIEFVLNEQIAYNMYPDCEKRLRPLVITSCQTLLKYRHLSVSKTIMDGNILDTGEFEVMLSKGLGQFFDENEKNKLFMDAGKISEIMCEVMERSTLEEKDNEINTSKVSFTEKEWYDINSMEMLVELGEKTLIEAKTQYKNLINCKDKPHVLDDYTIVRVINFYADEIKLIDDTEKQFSDWETKLDLNLEQKDKIKKGNSVIRESRIIFRKILTLAEELKKGTIDRILEKDDLELGIEFLLKQMKF
jgi:hypothetical protein